MINWKNLAQRVGITLAGETPTDAELVSINTKLDEQAAANATLTTKLGDEKTAHQATKDLLTAATTAKKTAEDALAAANVKITQYETEVGSRGVSSEAPKKTTGNGKAGEGVNASALHTYLDGSPAAGILFNETPVGEDE